ncbi:hypothetical protein Clacol_001570 [Clathrus columnatus]|uniref:Acetylornithine transaminase n=1 Tax=Clathrus columnatus TaxID=1419009 RepID=A0AAV5A1L0_9AGAM|nr:hypothetical protein Clacol_001570 [Clathrus columnatus]
MNLRLFSQFIPKKSILLPTAGRIRYVSNKPCDLYLPATHVVKDISKDQTEFLDRAEKTLLPVYVRPQEIVLSHGEGSYLFSASGQKYLDFSAGIAVNSLGHGDKEFIEVLTQQASKIIHSSNVYHNEHAAKLAALLIELTKRDGGLGWRAGETTSDNGKGAKVFFSNSGTEANEGALKIARMAGKMRWSAKTGKPWDSPDSECDKYRIVCFEHSFHGRSMGALSVTNTRKYQAPFEPLLPGVDVGRINDYSSLDALITDKTCAVIVEPIQGEGGINSCEESWLTKLRERCNQTDAVLIFDEIQASDCGLYRNGSLWAHSQYEIECHPDIVTMAKPLANGYPIGAIMMRDAIGQYMTAGTHGTTFGGSPLACALGTHVLSRLSHPQFMENIRVNGEHLDQRLRRLPEWFPHILQRDIRGRGLIRGLGFVEGKSPTKLVELSRQRGVLLLTGGADAVRIVPSLTITRDEIDKAVDVIESALMLM